MDYFIELLQVSLGNRCKLSGKPTEHEWKYMFSEAERQTLVGILACGIEHLPIDQRPSQAVILQWIGLVQMTERRNAQLTRACSQLCNKFKDDGFRVCVLKGQANHAYYPVEMADRRNSGDIDLWVTPVEHNNHPVSSIITYLENNYKMTGLCWLHASMNDETGIPVEVHFYPSFMNEPFGNHRFLKYFSSISKCACIKDIHGLDIPAMKVDYDVIYQMNHIYRHLIDEGVGLRQIVDYYFLLKKLKDESEKNEVDYAGIKQTIEWLGMKRFAGALMYVLKEVLGMPEEYLLFEPSIKDGEFLRDEILMSGNFGHHDPRMGTIATGGYMKSRISQAWRRFKRNLRFLTSYPVEVIWEPVVRVEHFVWKKLKLWRLE